MHLNDHFIIAGYGLPGRAVAEALDHLHLPYCVLELNAATVNRCAKREPTSLKVMSPIPKR